MANRQSCDLSQRLRQFADSSVNYTVKSLMKLTKGVIFNENNTCGQLHIHITCLTYGRSQISLCILRTLLWRMHSMNNTAYFAFALSYVRKMFIKSTTGVNLIKHFLVY
jgi:hypothetical protein